MSNPQDEFDLDDDDDDIDAMAKFIEGADEEIVKDHSNMLEDDSEKIAKNRERKEKDTNLPEEKKKAEIYGGRG